MTLLELRSSVDGGIDESLDTLNCNVVPLLDPTKLGWKSTPNTPGGVAEPKLNITVLLVDVNPVPVIVTETPDPAL